jgi:hypothetical protein
MLQAVAAAGFSLRLHQDRMLQAVAAGFSLRLHQDRMLQAVAAGFSLRLSLRLAAAAATAFQTHLRLSAVGPKINDRT